MTRSKMGSITFFLLVTLIIPVSKTTITFANEPQTRILNEQELIDIIVGSCIQSTRGCETGESIKQITKALSEGEEFKLISTDNFPNDWMVVAVQGIGGGGAWEHVIERTQKQNLPTITESEANSRVVDLLSEHMGQEVKALIRSEAAGATTTALLVAASKGIPTIDAGITGRAVPEVQQSIPWINGIASIPTAIITRWGDEIIIKDAVDEYRVEDLSRAIAVASGGDATITMTPMSGEQIKQGAIPGNLSEAMLFGKTVREARQRGEDPIAALLAVTNGYKLFQGIVTKSDERGDRGFNWVDVEIEGINEYKGSIYKIFVKNENIIAWLDDAVDVMSPDYIYNLNPKTGESITGGIGYGGYPLNEEVVMIGLPAHEQWRNRKGVELIGPKHFGFDFEYIPIEDLQ